MGKPQPVDLETVQLVSFDEMLKDEEKKLLVTQEVSAPSVAAVLAATQVPLAAAHMPLAAEAAPAPEMTVEVEADKTRQQGVSAKSIKNQPLTNPPPQKTGKVQSKLNAGINSPSGEISAPLTTVDFGSEVEKVVAQPASPIKVDGGKITAEDSRVPESGLKIDGSQNQPPANIREAVKEVSLESVAKPQSASAASAPPVVLRDGVAASQPQRADEKKEVEGKQEVDPRTVAVGLSKETVVVKDAGKLSMTRVDHAQAADVLQQITSHMKVRIKSGNSSMHLQLNPRDLGAIDVQMVKGTQGVSVTFFAEQAATGQLLETQINQLRQSLKDAGVQLAGLNISQYDQPKQEGGFYKQESHFSQYSQRSAPQTESAGKERERSERVGRSANEVDYLI